MAEAGTGTSGAQANTGTPTSAANNSGTGGGTGGDNNRALFYSLLSYSSFYICISVYLTLFSRIF